MKLLLALFAAICIATVYSEDATIKTEQAEVEECMNESKVDMKLFNDMHTNPNFVPTREMQCFASCLMKKKNLMDASGKYTETFHKTEISQTCKPEYGKDECETAGKLMACLNQHELMETVKADLGKTS